MLYAGLSRNTTEMAIQSALKASTNPTCGGLVIGKHVGL